MTPLVMQCSAPSWAAEPASRTQTRWLVGFWVATRCEDKRWEVGKYASGVFSSLIIQVLVTVSAQVSRPSFSHPFFSTRRVLPRIVFAPRDSFGHAVLCPVLGR